MEGAQTQIDIANKRLISDGAKCPYDQVDRTDKSSLKYDDLFYSNSPKAGTSVIHAISKAVFSEVREWTKEFVNVPADKIIDKLSKKYEDKKGLWPTDLDG